MPLELVGAAEVAELLGVSRQRLHQILREEADTFPEPLATLKAGMIWDKKQIDRWAQRYRPPPAAGKKR